MERKILGEDHQCSQRRLDRIRKESRPPKATSRPSPVFSIPLLRVTMKITFPAFCSIYIVNEAMVFFQEKIVNVMEWPVCSPDLNPIVNVWRTLTIYP